jgi:hypothetical protein
VAGTKQVVLLAHKACSIVPILATWRTSRHLIQPTQGNTGFYVLCQLTFCSKNSKMDKNLYDRDNRTMGAGSPKQYLNGYPTKSGTDSFSK